MFIQALPARYGRGRGRKMRVMKKDKILIVDDSEMNRAILADMLGESYDIIEAEDGVQAIVVLQRMHDLIDLVLLDIVMPQMDGFGVLHVMNKNHWIEDIPVIMVSSEHEVSQIEKAYQLGVTDFIMRPFDTFIVRHRVVNTLLLYAKQKQLINLVEEQLYEKEQNNSVMVDILSHIVEFRNGESGMHVLHVRIITDFLLRKLKLRTDQYSLTEDGITIISNASALHDIGKIGIDEKVLNKPGRLTVEEYELMKKHTLIGAGMLEDLTLHQGNPMVKAAYEICRWHHERYDGRGYPDGLAGDDIPISAQVVALADVYDALTSVRVYKAGYQHDTAVQMILNGECGSFNPLLLECLREFSDDLRKLMETDVIEAINQREVKKLANTVLSAKGNSVSKRTLRLLDYERMKNSFYSAMSEEIQFEYTLSSNILTFSPWGAKKLGVSEVILDPQKDAQIQKLVGEAKWQEIRTKIQTETSPEAPEISFELALNCGGRLRLYRVVIRTVWSMDEPCQREGVLGEAIPAEQESSDISENG